MTFWEYQYSSATTAPPGNRQLRFDAAPPYTDVTRLFVSTETSLDRDVYHSLVGIPPGRILYVQDLDDHTRLVQLRVTGPPVDGGGYFEIPVEWLRTDLPLTGQACALIITTELSASPSPPVRLETLANAKLHLHITDPARDAEVIVKLEHASALIYEYIGARADPTWNELTAPDVVQAATLKMLAHLYEHRGDDAASVFGPDAKVWDGISALLMRARDPAVS